MDDRDSTVTMSKPTVHVRQATQDDRPRILEISSQIWDGDDYVPSLLDAWIADTAGELVVAALDNTVIAFAHRTWSLPGIAWLEGIRTDPAYQGCGAGKAMTEHLIASSRAAGATHINLSTYIDNEASIHIIEAYGFGLVATFSYLERTGDLPPPDARDEEGQIRPLSELETLAFVKDSAYLALAQRQFSHGWKFLPFDRDPNKAIAPLAYCLGYWQSNALKAVVCVRQEPAGVGPCTLNFLDGEPEAMTALLSHTLRAYAGRALEVMLPTHQGKHAAALRLLQDMGFESWSGFKADVFVYEMIL
jgi:ribosomal protein S18 acetylase RimI-like enzyme